jgi:hypothetical protein
MPFARLAQKDTKTHVAIQNEADRVRG